MTHRLWSIGGVFRSGVLVAALSGTPAAAQQPTFGPLQPEPEEVTLTPFIGAGFSGNLESVPRAFGVALGYGWSERLALEGELSLSPRGSMGTPIEFDTSMWMLSANVLYHFAQPSFTPYVTAGVGVMGSNPDIPAELFPDLDERSTTLAWNIGTGLKAALNDRLGVRADLRHFNASDLAPDHWRLYGGVVIRRLWQ